MWLILLTWALGKYTLNVNLIGPIISLAAKTIPVGVAIKHTLLPHPHMVNNAHSGTWEAHAKFKPN